jgi:hypothetical protein
MLHGFGTDARVSFNDLEDMPLHPHITYRNSTTNISSYSVATGYGLDGRRFGIRIPVGQHFSLLHSVQTGSGTQPAYYPMGTGGSFPGGTVAEA